MFMYPCITLHPQKEGEKKVNTSRLKMRRYAGEHMKEECDWQMDKMMIWTQD